MAEHNAYTVLVIVWFAVAVCAFVGLFFVTAPYGRHARAGWGLSVSARLGWVLMEAPAALAFAGCALWGIAPGAAASLAFLALWELHYVYRAFVYPLQLRDGRPLPVAIVAMGFSFNLVNAYLNGRWLFTLSGGYAAAWLLGPRFLVGTAVFVAGCVLNRSADETLRRLRAPGESGYRIPTGGLYRWVSCPNYLGEIMVWVGWAIATWSLPGLAFAVWTAANLAPRARSHHRWYHERFAEYPPERKALIPLVW